MTATTFIDHVNFIRQKIAAADAAEEMKSPDTPRDGHHAAAMYEYQLKAFLTAVMRDIAAIDAEDAAAFRAAAELIALRHIPCNDGTSSDAMTLRTRPHREISRIFSRPKFAHIPGDYGAGIKLQPTPRTLAAKQYQTAALFVAALEAPDRESDRLTDLLCFIGRRPYGFNWRRAEFIRFAHDNTTAENAAFLRDALLFYIHVRPAARTGPAPLKFIIDQYNISQPPPPPP